MPVFFLAIFKAVGAILEENGREIERKSLVMLCVVYLTNQVFLMLLS